MEISFIQALFALRRGLKVRCVRPYWNCWALQIVEGKICWMLNDRGLWTNEGTYISYDLSEDHKEEINAKWKILK